MKALALLTGTLLFAGAAGHAQDTTAAKAAGAGRALFLRHCASCHGTDAKGGGPTAASLKTPPPDLTTLPAKDGKFDEARVRTSIDGTQAATAHGTRDMPVWGKVFAKAGDKRGPGWAQTDVWKLVEYIKSIQSAPAAK